MKEPIMLTENYWGSVIAFALVVFLITAIVFAVYDESIDNQNSRIDESNKISEYVNFLLYAASGQSDSVVSRRDYSLESVIIEEARIFGEFLRQNRDADTHFSWLLKSGLLIDLERVLYDYATGVRSDLYKSLAKTDSEMSSQAMLYMMANSENWRSFVFLDNSSKLLNAALVGKFEALPKLKHKDFYTKWQIVVYIILLSQLGGFIGYLLIYCQDHKVYKWYRLNWNRHGVILTTLLILPGAVPGMALATSVGAVVFGIRLLGRLIHIKRNRTRHDEDARDIIIENSAQESRQALERLSQRAQKMSGEMRREPKQ